MCQPNTQEGGTERRAIGVWLLSWFINIGCEKDRRAANYANWHICFIYLFSKQTGFFWIFFFSFLFIPSHWKGGKRKVVLFTRYFWTPQMGEHCTHTGSWREIERKVDSHRATAPVKNLDTVQNFPNDWIIITKNLHNNTKKQKCLSHTVWLGIVPAFFFFFFFKCLPHRERGPVGGGDRSSRMWAGQEGNFRGESERVRRDRGSRREGRVGTWKAIS